MLEDQGGEGKSRYGRSNHNIELWLTCYFCSFSHVSNALGSSYLPPKPSIFYGREEVIDAIVKSITTQESAKIAVLGSGGVGKVRATLS